MASVKKRLFRAVGTAYKEGLSAAKSNGIVLKEQGADDKHLHFIRQSKSGCCFASVYWMNGSSRVKKSVIILCVAASIALSACDSKQERNDKETAETEISTTESVAEPIDVTEDLV